MAEKNIEEKDIEKMTDEELREYTRKLLAKIKEGPDCFSCPVISCPRRKVKVKEESETLEDED
ncbi:MAG: hypothetical protein ACPLRA_06495 [Candidatus Saccharicenans sp.]